MTGLLGFRVRDLDTGAVLLTQTVSGDGLELATTEGAAVEYVRVAAAYAAEVALAVVASTGHSVALEVYDAEGDVAPAGEWTAIDRLDPP